MSVIGVWLTSGRLISMHIGEIMTMRTSRGSLNHNLSSLIGIWLADLAGRKYRWLTAYCQVCVFETVSNTHYVNYTGYNVNIKILFFLFIHDSLPFFLFSLHFSFWLLPFIFINLVLFSFYTVKNWSPDKSFCTDIGTRLHWIPTDLFFEITLSVIKLTVQFCKHRPQLSDKLFALSSTNPSIATRSALFVTFYVFPHNFLASFSRVTRVQD